MDRVQNNILKTGALLTLKVSAVVDIASFASKYSV
jgi:hypothetical protein